MDHLEHANLEEWAQNYGGTAILGFICTLLIGGKFVHHIFQRRGLVCGALIIPPAMMSGVLGITILKQSFYHMTSGHNLDGTLLRSTLQDLFGFQ